MTATIHSLADRRRVTPGSPDDPEQAAIDAYVNAVEPLVAGLELTYADHYRERERAEAVEEIRQHLRHLAMWAEHLERLGHQFAAMSASEAARSFLRSQHGRRAYVADVVHRAGLQYFLAVEEERP